MKTEGSVISTVIGASGAVPLVLAQTTAPRMEGVTMPIWAISILLTSVLAVLGYLLKRSWEQVDRTLEKLDARVERLDTRVEGFERRMSDIERKL